jgi:hypothetical protein
VLASVRAESQHLWSRSPGNRRQGFGEHSGRQIQSHSLAAEFGQKANITAGPAAEVQDTALADNATDEGLQGTYLRLPVLRIS